MECVGTGAEVVCVVPDAAPPEAAPTSLLSGALLVLPFFLWGTSMAAMKSVLPHSGPLLVAAVRLLPSGALLVIYALARGRSNPQGLKAWAAVALFGLVDGTAFQACLAEGLTKSASLHMPSLPTHADARPHAQPRRAWAASSSTRSRCPWP